jgi:ATP-dependent Lhr-like helicase
MEEYDPEWLDAHCLSGRVVWARLTPARGAGSGPVRSTPIALMNRKNVAGWEAVFPGSTGIDSRDRIAELTLSSGARLVLEYMFDQGASFFSDLVEGTGLLPSQAEDALGELVSFGLVTADSFTGLRALLTPSNKRPVASGRRKGSVAAFGMENAGRWSRLRRAPGLKDGNGVARHF